MSPSLPCARPDAGGTRGDLSLADREALICGLDQVEDELRHEHFHFREDDEDIHMAIERRLTEIVGVVGGRLLTACSRNDQAVSDLVLYVRARGLAAQEQITQLMAALLRRAEEHIDWPMSGYTHLQRA
jgi:argininosuccinate lyase